MNESGVRAMIQCVHVQINLMKSSALFVKIMIITIMGISPGVQTTSNGQFLAQANGKKVTKRDKGRETAYVDIRDIREFNILSAADQSTFVRWKYCALQS